MNSSRFSIPLARRRLREERRMRPLVAFDVIASARSELLTPIHFIDEQLMLD